MSCTFAAAEITSFAFLIGCGEDSTTPRLEGEVVSAAESRSACNIKASEDGFYRRRASDKCVYER